VAYLLNSYLGKLLAIRSLEHGKRRACMGGEPAAGEKPLPVTVKVAKGALPPPQGKRKESREPRVPRRKNKKTGGVFGGGETLLSY